MWARVLNSVEPAELQDKCSHVQEDFDRKPG